MLISLAARRISIHTRLADLFYFVAFVIHCSYISLAGLCASDSCSVNPYFYTQPHFYWISSVFVSFLVCYLYHLVRVGGIVNFVEQWYVLYRATVELKCA